MKFVKSERELKADWLSRSKPLRLRLISLKAVRLERLSRADYGGISYSGERTGGSGGNSTERKIAALTETNAEIAEIEKQLEKIEAEISDAIDKVRSPLCQTYLRMRFLAYKSEHQIAHETNYTYTYINGTIRKKALDLVNIP